MDFPVFQLTFTLTWWDLLMATLRLTARQRILWLAAACLGGFRTWTAIRNGADYGGAVASGLIVFVVLVLVYFTLVPLMSMTRRARLAGLELKVDLTETQIRITHALAKTEIKWATVQRIAVGSESLYLTLGPGQLFPIPRRALPEAAHWNQLVRFCRSRIPSAGG